MRELALFAGCGGGVLGGLLMGWKTIGYVEINDYCQRVIRARIDDGIFHNAPIFGDIRQFIGQGYAASYSGLVDVVSGGFPCTDISVAGRGAGIDGAQSGLWYDMLAVIRIVGPRYVFVENSPALTFRGLGIVLRDLAEVGFDARWGVLSACAQGAPHARERLFLVANSNRGVVRASGPAEDQADTANMRERRIVQPRQVGSWWAIQPEPCSVAYGHAGLVDELRPYGNAQVPAVARAAWRLLSLI